MWSWAGQFPKQALIVEGGEGSGSENKRPNREPGSGIASQMPDTCSCAGNEWRGQPIPPPALLGLPHAGSPPDFCRQARSAPWCPLREASPLARLVSQCCVQAVLRTRLRLGADEGPAGVEE